MMKRKMPPSFFGLGLMLALACHTAHAQNYWSPDSTAFRYLSRGDNLQQWQASLGTRVERDTSASAPARGAIKWTIPPQTADATLELSLVDIDLRGQVLYTVCRRNNNAAPITVTLFTGAEQGFRLHQPVYADQSGKHLPVTHWQQRGTTISWMPVGGAKPGDLAHTRFLRFRSAWAEVEQVVWIAEVKHTAPRGPAALIHFNHYRDSADSLLTPWLLAQGYRANIDFTYDMARNETQQLRGESGIWTRYLGLARIHELARNYEWSTTHHGTFYKILPTLPREERLQIYDLAPFQQAGFEAQWCFSIPSDEITPELYEELVALKRFPTIRRQGDRRPNELPLDEPQQLRFFRPTSASAGPNVTGTPRTLAQMKAEIDEAYAIKGLLIFDFGAIVTQPSPAYTGSEVTTLSDAKSIIQYADSLGFPFLTFADLLAPAPNYRQLLSINHDYVQHRPGALFIPVLKNDLGPRGDSLRVVAVGAPRYGEAFITADQQSVRYSLASKTAQEDRFYYIASNGVMRDTAWVFVVVPKPSEVEESAPPATFVFAQSFPNPFQNSAQINYEMPQSAYVELEIYNLAGQRVATLVRARKLAGQHRAVFRAAHLPSGVYFYQLKLDGHVAARNKMVHWR